MSVISFQGAVFVKTQGQPIVYLPTATANTHLDSQTAARHFPRLWVANGAVAALGTGFVPDASQTGVYADLDGGNGRGRAFHIVVEGITGAPVVMGKLKAHLFSFSKFANKIGTLVGASSKSVARIPLTLGTIDFELTDSQVGPPWVAPSASAGRLGCPLDRKGSRCRSANPHPCEGRAASGRLDRRRAKFERWADHRRQPRRPGSWKLAQSPFDPGWRL